MYLHLKPKYVILYKESFATLTFGGKVAPRARPQRPKSRVNSPPDWAAGNSSGPILFGTIVHMKRTSESTKYFVYILECADKSLYVGCTNNLEKRVHEHNNLKSGAHYTKIRRPVVLKYNESFATLLEARGREAEIKGWVKSKKVALIEGKENLRKY